MKRFNLEKIYSFIERVLGKSEVYKFKIDYLDMNGNDTFELSSENEKIKIRGNSAIAITSGINWYLKNYLNVHMSLKEENLNLPKIYPKIAEKIVVTSPFKYRYYLNYCTYGYSMAFWDFETWEKELDLMALNGVNLVLSLTGQEEVLRRTLLKIGFSNEECKRYITDPTHLPWLFMGNMSGTNKPLPDKWFEDRVILGRKIHERMLELNITPILQGFYGAVPEKIKNIYKDIKLYPQGTWCGYERPSLLSPEDPRFNEISHIFYNTQKEIFGDITPFFELDPFHEGGSYEKYDLPHFGEKIIENLNCIRKDAVWVVQAWGSNPREELFKNINKNKVLILNLLVNRKNLCEITEGFYGIPWIWCPIHNYGGRNGMYGFLRVIGREPYKTMKSKYGQSMVGIGMAPEAIETDPIVKELFSHMAFEKEEINIKNWIPCYIKRRYGKVSGNTLTAWLLLQDSIYNSFLPQDGGVESFICARPNYALQCASTWGPKNIDFDVEYIEKAAKLMFKDYEELKDNENYLYDLVDVTRQVLADKSRFMYEKVMYAVDQNNYENFERFSSEYLELIKDSDKLLATRKEFLVGNFLDKAYKLGKKYHREIDFLEEAKTLLTIWGTEEASKSLHDYSSRQWSGLMTEFYLMRWSLFFEDVKSNLIKRINLENVLIKEWEEQKHLKDSHENIKWYEIEKDWVEKPILYPTAPTGEIKEIVKEVLNKYVKSINN